ncbi:AAA family ATPase [Alicyclobacillus sp. ALC3]|uniref:AAA family ATPase n=1 Tax=Alicyclobacillus sp. ALC3 TaxID=2796143 RepID=UPI0023787AF6|nr:MoxR family ATPase [Alicyclobacillus sp. ALC3]
MPRRNIVGIFAKSTQHVHCDGYLRVSWHRQACNQQTNGGTAADLRVSRRCLRKESCELKNPFASIAELQASLVNTDYLASTSLATTLFLGLTLERPVFLEGAPGVGKTEVAKAMARVLGRDLVRLQCYEGIDRQSALYEWNYGRQLLHIRLAEAAYHSQQVNNTEVAHKDSNALEHFTEVLEGRLYGPEFLLERPLLTAVKPGQPAPVLLIDEVDRSDEEFEAYLLELLAEYQVTIPEWGTIRAEEIPLVVLTSNRTREVHDALKRRCLYAWVDYPSLEDECAIVRRKVPQVDEQLALQACSFVHRLRREPLFKLPGVAETIHWAQALDALSAHALSAQVVEATLGCLLKYRDDLEHMTRSIDSESNYVQSMLADVGVRT